MKTVTLKHKETGAEVVVNEADKGNKLWKDYEPKPPKPKKAAPKKEDRSYKDTTAKAHTYKAEF